MKKIIDGKMYNTETAEKIWHYDNGETGFDWCEETLYQKKTGEFFIYGKGGARTIYAFYEGNQSYSGGNRVSPLTNEDAREWVENYCDKETYAKLFGDSVV